MSAVNRGEAAPIAALALGLAGLIPFVSLAVLAATVPEHYVFWLTALAFYGATIVSFVGALHWGYAVKRSAEGLEAWMQYGWSVVPALIAWSSLLAPVWTGLRMQAAALVACYAVDRVLSRFDPVPRWLMRLRAVLTAVGTASLAVASVV